MKCKRRFTCVSPETTRVNTYNQIFLISGMATAKAICLNCHQPITKGRADKKFCNSACKDAYYNTIKSEEQQEISKIDIILKRNRRILKKYFDPYKETIVSRDMLLKQGFDFDYFTHFIVTKLRSNEFRFCYDYGYREIENSTVKIIKSFK